MMRKLQQIHSFSFLPGSILSTKPLPSFLQLIEACIKKRLPLLKGFSILQITPLSQRQTSNGMTKPILYHKTHTAWQKSYCMSFAMPSYFPWIHGKTHVISALPYPWLFPCSNQSVTSRLETSRYRDFSQFFESIGLGLENFGLKKKSRYRSRKYLV